MSDAPRRYPRIPYIVAPASGVHSSDRVLQATDLAERWNAPCVIEEKLDGANVRIEMQDGALVVSGRSGSANTRSAKRMGRIRAELYADVEAWQALLKGGRVVFAEWLMERHCTAYPQLPSWLVVLDIWQPGEGFVPVATRNAWCQRLGLTTPPAVFRGVLSGVETLERLPRTSAFGACELEGFVVRWDAEGGPWARGKWVVPGFVAGAVVGGEGNQLEVSAGRGKAPIGR